MAGSATAAADNKQTANIVGLEQLLRLDPRRPFANTQDAVERLIPFHLLATMSAAEEDPEHQAAAGRHPTHLPQDAWEQSQVQAVQQLQATVNSLCAGLVTAHTTGLTAEGLRAQDDLAISSYQAAEAQKRLADLKSQRASEAKEAAHRLAAAAAAAPVNPAVLETPPEQGLLMPGHII
mmetsp:Transcript_4091/g.11859  ORF Transcript_4091/g.11859 Transcript_4091/m.11859 type:complete len:179 (+) Transcript_4091:199-735(+)